MFKNSFVLLILTLVMLSINLNITVAEKNVSSPKITAKGAVLIDYETGRVLWGNNENTPLAMASTTKIMTAITAIEKGNLSDEVVVSKRSASAPKTKMNLETGEKIQLKNLLYALMLESANDSAIAIAEHIGGSVENFCSDMTKKAKEIGAKNTVFKTPNGLDLDDHHSTAYDMAIIARYALRNEIFREIISTRSISFKSNKKSYSFTNKDRLLSEYEGAIGVKTGFTGKAGHCFVGSAKRDDLWLVSTVLASGWGNKGKEQKWIDTKNLLNYGFENFEYVTPFTEGEKVCEIPVKKGNTETIKALLNNSIKLCIKKDGSEKVRLEKKVAKELVAPIKRGDRIGFAEVYINDELVSKIEIISGTTTAKKTFIDYFENIVKFWSLEKIF